MTQEQVTKQYAPLWVIGPPEGRDDGPPGYVEVDVLTGKWYRKSTNLGTKTGWLEFSTGSSSGGIEFAEGPTDPPEDGTILKQGYKNTTTTVKFINTAWPNTASPVWEAF